MIKGMDLSNVDFEDVDFADDAESIVRTRQRTQTKRISIDDFDRIEGKEDDPQSAWFDGSKVPVDWDADLTSQSEAEYIDVAHEIVDTSIKQLDNQNASKATLKQILCIFFMCFIGIQYIALLVIFALEIFQVGLRLPNEIVIAYITSIFVETLGAIILMIKYAFDSKQETQVLKILNGVISNFQKFNGNSSTSKKK